MAPCVVVKRRRDDANDATIPRKPHSRPHPAPRQRPAQRPRALSYKVLIALKARCPIVGAAPPAPAAALRERLAFNVAIENPLIIVHGDTATSQVIFTEYRQEKAGDPMKFTTQGKEYATWVKVNGRWLYKTRQMRAAVTRLKAGRTKAPG